VRKRISIDELAPGMFVEAQVSGERDEGQLRHFLAPIDAVYAEETNKRARLTRRKYKQVAHSGGLLLSSQTHVEALRSTGLSVITINTDKGADVGAGVDTVGIPDDLAVDSANFTDILLGPEGGVTEPSTPAAQEEDCFLDVLESATAPRSDRLTSATPAVTGPNSRIPLGTSGKGWMKVETSADGQQAVLRVLSFGGDDTLGLEDVLQALEGSYGLRSGFDQTLISQLVAQAKSAPRHVIRGNFSVAEAQAPAAVAPASPPSNVEFTFLDGVEDADSLAFATLRTALALEDLDAILGLDPVTRGVIPGEKLAVTEQKSEDQSLLDIFGRQQEEEGPDLKAGEHVTLAGNSYVSEIFGYVCCLDELSVVSPLWLSPDGVEAYFIAFRQVGTPSVPTRQWLQQLCDQAGIIVGSRADAIDELTHGWPAQAEPRAILIASGTPPIPGQDAHISYEFDTALWPGAFLEDGSVDFHERNAYRCVERGQFIGTIHPATTGEPGRSVTGQTVEATDGEHDIFDLGENFRVEGDPKRLYARVDGSVRVRGNAVRLHEVIRVDGDVNFSMGNIDAGKDVYITGSIKPGFEIRLGGDLTIGGTIEGGAIVHAGGDVTVAGGIVGHDTKVVALGSVFAKFIQNASVIARLDVFAGNYLLNAEIRVGGRVVVRQTSDGRGGSIVGGQTLAGQRIDAWTVGSASTDRTIVGIVAPPETAAGVRKIEKTVEFCDQFVGRAFRTLGLETIDTTELKQLIDRTPKDERQPILTVLQQLKKATTTRARALEKRASLKNKSRKQLTGGEIHVRHIAHADVEIRISDQHITLDTDLDGPVFCWAENEVLAR
jgi:uncharacterized protein